MGPETGLELFLGKFFVAHESLETRNDDLVLFIYYRSARPFASMIIRTITTIQCAR